MKEMVILVDRNDNEIGFEEKMKAHRDGNLHRAFSIFIFNKKGEILLQRRALNKYHSGGLWSNTCCSHPHSGESVEQAAHRRLKEEMGFDCDLKKAFHFIYRAELGDDLVEHEFDHVFVGTYEGEVNPDQHEVDSYKWMDINTLKQDMKDNPENYTAWFKIAFDKVIQIETNA